MSVLALDFETYFHDDYGFAKLTTEQYVRSPLFEVICVAVYDGNAATSFTGTMVEVGEWLRQFELERHAVAMHNAMFDAAVLSWHFNIRPGKIIDTLSMANGVVPCDQSKSLAALTRIYLAHLEPKGDDTRWAKGKRRDEFTLGEMQLYRAYCEHDARLCYGLAVVLGRLYGVALKSEMELIDWTIRAFTEPKLVLDTKLLQVALQEHRVHTAELLRQSGVADVSQLRSDTTFAALLRQVGVDPPMKISKATGEPAYAFAKTDPDFVALEDHDDIRVQALVAARLGNKTTIVESRIKRLIEVGSRGALPVPLTYCEAITTRWAGTDKINLQNLPKDDLNGGPSKIRRAVMAPSGFKLLVADLAQIELRVLAWAAGQTDVLDTLRRDGDVYSDMASAIYGRPINKHEHPVERFVGKTAELGCGYSASGVRFSAMLKTAANKYKVAIDDTSVPFGQFVVDAYRDRHRAVVALWGAGKRALSVLARGGEGVLGPFRVSDGAVWLPNGMPTRYPNLVLSPDEDGQMQWQYNRRKRGVYSVKLYGAKLVENTIQGAARCVMTDAMLRIMKRIRIVGTVHDELWCLIPDTVDEARAVSWVREQMTIPPTWAPDLPLACDIHVGRNYAEAK